MRRPRRARVQGPRAGGAARARTQAGVHQLRGMCLEAPCEQHRRRRRPRVRRDLAADRVPVAAASLAQRCAPLVLPSPQRPFHGGTGLTTRRSRSMAAISIDGGDDDGPLASLYVGGLPFGLDDEGLAAWLRDEAGVSPVCTSVARKRNGWSKGHARVDFATADAARAAVSALDGAVGPNPARRLVAREWGADSSQSKRPEPAAQITHTCGATSAACGGTADSRSLTRAAPPGGAASLSGASEAASTVIVLAADDDPAGEAAE